MERRSVLVNMRTHIPEKLLQISSETRTILATNKNKFLKVYLYFTEPVMNSSAEILNSINTNQGSLVPISGSSRGQHRFGYQLTNISDMAIVTVSLQSNLVITRQGTPVAPVSPVTFLYDGILQVELNRMLQSGGYFSWVAQPIYKHEAVFEEQ